MKAKDACELGARGEVRDRAADARSVNRAGIDRLADVNEPLRECVSQVLARSDPRHQKAALAVADDWFKLWQMRGDHGPTYRQRFENKAGHALEFGGQDA